MLRPDSLALSSLLVSTSPRYFAVCPRITSFQTIPSLCTHNATRIQTRAAQGQLGGETDLQPLPKLTAPGISKPKSDDSEEPAPLAFSTGAPESEPDDDDNGLVVDGSYPAVELQR
jgi:hypothetical protein